MQKQSSYKVYLNTICNGELSDPLCDSVKLEVWLKSDWNDLDFFLKSPKRYFVAKTAKITIFNQDINMIIQEVQLILKNARFKKTSSKIKTTSEFVLKSPLGFQ